MMTDRLARAEAPGAHDYLARPAAAGGAGVLVLAGWWGVDPALRATCDRLAAAGFLALAPDLYDGAVAGTILDAQRLRSRLRRPAVGAALTAAATWLAGPGGGGPRLGLLGFSQGAYWALWLATRVPKVAGVVLYYGIHHARTPVPAVPVLGHFAARDRWISATAREHLAARLTEAGRPPEFHVYPGTHHWFAEMTRPDVYDPGAAALAWERTRAFLTTHLAAEPGARGA